MSEQIKDNFLWDGHQTKYGYNAWGETIEGGSIQHIKVQPYAHHQLDSSDNSISRDTNMLIQILYDIADEKGCVSRVKLKDALNFVLDYYNIVPTRKNRFELIYALRRLGYIVAYYDGKDYVNQLVTPYLERTNYSFVAGDQNNVYLIKGIYSKETLQTIINSRYQVKYKMPYPDSLLELHPEYKCLPYHIFVKNINGQEIEGWDVVDHPVAYDYVDAMANMKDFETYFKIKNGGDTYMGWQGTMDVPCMIKVNDKEELCAINERGQYVLCRNYSGHDNICRDIPIGLSRLYCQNVNKNPIVILNTDRSDHQDKINNSMITILKKMGIPELFDIALCDLNLGLPENNYCFVVDNKDSKLPHKENDIYSLGDTYNTANSVKQIHSGLEKMAARNIDMDDYFHSSSVFMTARNIGYCMKMIAPTEGSIYLGLFDGDEKDPTAFCVGSRKVYKKDEHSDYKEILGDATVNAKLSDVINYRTVDCGDSFIGTLPNFDKAINVKIIKKY